MDSQTFEEIKEFDDEEVIAQNYIFYQHQSASEDEEEDTQDDFRQEYLQDDNVFCAFIFQLIFLE